MSDPLAQASQPIPDPRMPEVELVPDIEDVFDRVRRAARGELTTPQADPKVRHVVIRTPGRLLMFKACPPAGSMKRALVDTVEGMIPSNNLRQIAVISYTEVSALRANLSGSIPFFGFLLGFAAIGHTVWVFEGHPSALGAGCRNADVLFVDSGMLPFLQPDWKEAAREVMRRKDIVVHDRAGYRLSRG